MEIFYFINAIELFIKIILKNLKLWTASSCWQQICYFFVWNIKNWASIEREAISSFKTENWSLILIKHQFFCLKREKIKIAVVANEEFI